MIQAQKAELVDTITERKDIQLVPFRKKVLQ